MREFFSLLLLAGLMVACGEKTPVNPEPESKDYAQRMAQEHAGDQPTPSPAATNAATAEVIGKMEVYARLGGKPVQGYVVYPAQAEGALPGVLMFHEWWGLNDNIKSMANQLAAQGYAVLAADFYGGRVAQEPSQAQALMQEALGQQLALQSNINQGFEFLRSQMKAARIGTLGWCFGGTMSFEAAKLLGAESDATVIYYGFVNSNPAELAKIKAPVLGIFGAQDQGIPLATVRAFEQALSTAGKPAQIEVYAQAGHAFANPSGQNYRATDAEDAWRKTLAFLSQYLQAVPPEQTEP
jgi:carboxymethylenebutenolidase